MQGSLYPAMIWGQPIYGDLTHHYPENLFDFHGFMNWHSAFSGRLSYLCRRYTLPHHCLDPGMMEQEISWDEIENMIKGANVITAYHCGPGDPYTFNPIADNLRDIYIGIRTEYEQIKNALLNSK